MVIFHGIITSFLVSIFLSLMILSINSLPQNYNENLNWRYQHYQPRTYNGYYSNQRYHQPDYRHLSNPSSSYESYGYHRPHTQPESFALLRPRSRGPSKEVLPEPGSKRNQFNSSEDSVNQAERGDRRIEASNKKETTRILNSPPMQPPKTSPDSDAMQDDLINDFVFPGHPILQPSTPPPMNSYVPDVNKVMSMCGSDAIFCDYRGNYPSDLIKKALNKTTEKYGDLLGRDQITSNVSISTRFDVTNDGTPMCGSKEKIIEPPTAKNKDNEWKWIVNEGPYVQGIRVEMCDNPDNPCQMADNFPIGYKTECRQKFIYRKLLVLEKSGQIEPDTFRLPSCCACIYRQDTVSRFMKPAFGTSPRRK